MPISPALLALPLLSPGGDDLFPRALEALSISGPSDLAAVVEDYAAATGMIFELTLTHRRRLTAVRLDGALRLEPDDVQRGVEELLLEVPSEPDQAIRFDGINADAQHFLGVLQPVTPPE